jgi:putative ABC transport system substrate-binding protein
MRRRDFITLVSGAAAAWPLAARGQQPDRMRLIGVLLLNSVEGDPTVQSWLVTFRDGLAKLGWTESNLRMEVRWGSGSALSERYAAELVALGSEVLVGDSTAALKAFQRQTKTIPIVFLGVADPIAQGFVASLAHPGGNVTGFSVFDTPMAGKWLEMLTQITPPVARVAVLFNPATAPYAGLMVRASDEAARSMALAVRAVPVNDDSEIETMMTGIAHEERSGVLVLPSAFTVSHRDAIVAIANRDHVPAVYGLAMFATNGGLMSYGSDLADSFRHAADYVSRILRGAKPADLPVQQPTKFELVINLKTAKALGITIAPSLLATADEVIE